MKLPVVEIAAEAYHAVWRYRRVLIDCAAVPLALVLGIGILEHLLADTTLPDPPASPDDAETPAAQGGGGPGFVGLAYLLLSLPFLVSWYRFLIDGPAGLAGRGAFAFGRLEGRFLLWALVLGALLAVPMIIAGTMAIPFVTGDLSGHSLPLMPLLLAMFFFILLILASLRLSLIFPAVAAEEPASLPRAWEMTKGNSFRILALAAVVHIPALLLGGVIEALALGLGLPFSVLLGIDLAVSFIVMGLGAAMFAESYKRLR